MVDKRIINAKRNMAVSLLGQLVSIVCGLITPRLLMKTYGSEAYGVVTAVLNFLAYITLLEGGVGGVVRAALYQPLAEDNRARVAVILREAERFFRILAGGFAVYTLVLALSFHSLADVTVLDWLSTFFLVLVIAADTFSNYFFGITNTLLLNASQRIYVCRSLGMCIILANTVATVILVKLGCSLLMVKLVSGIVFLLEPLILFWLRRRIYPLPVTGERDPQALKNKWVGLGQHIAQFLHTNTDVLVLTVFADLKKVAVYAVYNMVITQIQNLINSFCSSMEPMLGDMIAKKEKQTLDVTVRGYETMVSCIATTLLGTTSVMIVPFVQVYTGGVEDANYIQPVFALILTAASLLYCLRLPYHDLVVAAGHFRQTQKAAYMEAALNIGLSVLLVGRLGLTGAAIGTLVAVAARYVYYVFYLSRHIICRKVSVAAKRLLANVAAFGGSTVLGSLATKFVQTDSLLSWAVCAAAVFATVAVVTLGINFLFYRPEAEALLLRIKNRIKGK